jgi:hypothetical protein
VGGRERQSGIKAFFRFAARSFPFLPLCGILAGNFLIK